MTDEFAAEGHNSAIETADTAAEPTSRKRQVIIGVITLVVLAIVFVGILPQFADYGQAWDAARSLPAAWLALLAVAAIVNLVVYSLQWHAPLPELRITSAFGVSQTSYMVSNGVPGGGAFVLPVQFAMLAEYGVDRTKATAVTGVTAVWNLLATFLIPVLALCLLIGSGSLTPARWAGLIGGIAAFIAIGFTLGALIGSETTARRIGGLAERAAGRVLRVIARGKLSEKNLGWADAVANFRASTHDLLATRWAHITGAHLLGQFAQFAVLAIALAGLQRDLDPRTTIPTALFAFGVGRMGTLIPITPGGLGTVDGLLAALLVSAGNSTSSDALAAVLIWRVLTFLPGLIVGGITFLAWRRRSAKRSLAVPAR